MNKKMIFKRIIIIIAKKKKNNNNTNDQNEFSYSLIKGDLFTSPESSSLCHCISRDLAMGKGIAVTFKKQFGGLNTLKKQQLSVGECGILLRQNRYIYYLITKKKYFNKPSYGSIAKTLEYMKNHAVLNDVKHISMPKIGCGLDKLQWNRVEQIIKDVFAKTDIRITVYSGGPSQM